MPDSTTIRRVYFGPPLKDQDVSRRQLKRPAGPKPTPSIFEEGFTPSTFELLEVEDDPQQDIQDLVGRECQGSNHNIYIE